MKADPSAGYADRASRPLTNSMTNLKEHYNKIVIPAMQAKFGYKNILAVPRIRKVVLNVGLGSALKDQKFLESARDTLRIITGQTPTERKARKSIANFKIRKGQTIGLAVTLRGLRMYHFIERFINLALPRVRDFRGLDPNALDKEGNLTIGLREVAAFPEIRAGEAERQHGLEVTIVHNAKTRETGLELLRLIGFPFRAK